MHLREQLMRSVFKFLIMHNSKLLILFAVFLAFSCKKETPMDPVNAGENNIGLDCAICPSVFHPFDDLLIENNEDCDDLTDAINYPSDFFVTEGIVAFTQDDTYPVTLKKVGYLHINQSIGEPGFYGSNLLQFDFSGAEQEVRFIIYGNEATMNQVGFKINGSTPNYYSESFPQTIGGVIITIDFSIPNIGEYEVFEVTFSGKINSITQILYESGISDLCVNRDYTAIPPEIDKNNNIYFDDFYNYDETILGSYPTAKTPLGYYSLQATNMVIKFDDFLADAPTKISFVHVYTEGKSNLVNVQLPNIPLIITVPDSLRYFLEPYGYKVEHHYKTGAKMWTDIYSDPQLDKVLDSVIISGNNLNEVILGANLSKSELRSVCTYYEQ